MTERNYGIDLLRPILMFMVCVLHVLGKGGILAAVSFGTVEYKTFWLIETFAYFAVDAFAIISGYMASYDKPLKPRKLIGLWFQVFFYSFVVTAIFAAAGLYSDFSKIAVCRAALPVTFGTYWYVTAYFVVFLFAPIINKFIAGASENTARKLLLVFFFIFTVLESVNFSFKTVALARCFVRSRSSCEKGESVCKQENVGSCRFGNNLSAYFVFPSYFRESRQVYKLHFPDHGCGGTFNRRYLLPDKN